MSEKLFSERTIQGAVARAEASVARPDTAADALPNLP